MFKVGDKVKFKMKDEQWGDHWMNDNIYVVSSYGKAYSDSGHITLTNNLCDYRLVEPAEDKNKMTKFKVGDRVVSVNNPYTFCGKEGTITEVFYSEPILYGVVIDDTNENTWEWSHYESELELVEEDQMTYKTWEEMSPEEKGALLLAHHEGKTIEYSGDPSIGWLDTLGVPTWGSYVYYRVQPEETAKEPEREVVAFKTQNHTYIKVNDSTFANYSCGGGVAMYDGLEVFEENLPEADKVFYKGDTISFVL